MSIEAGETRQTHHRCLDTMLRVVIIFRTPHPRLPAGMAFSLDWWLTDDHMSPALQSLLFGRLISIILDDRTEGRMRAAEPDCGGETYSRAHRCIELLVPSKVMVSVVPHSYCPRYSQKVNEALWSILGVKESLVGINSGRTYWSSRNKEANACGLTVGASVQAAD